MSKFVQLAINLQTEATTIQEAQRAFKTSCKMCSSRGLKLECDACPISTSHNLTIAIINDLKEIANTQLIN